MNSFNPKKIFALIAINGYLIFGFGQNDPWHFGVAVETNFSGLKMNGLTTGINFSRGNHDLLLGPRIIYDDDRSHPIDFVGDLEYRYTFFNSDSKFGLYLNSRLEFAYRNYNRDYLHDPTGFTPIQHAPIGDSTFYATLNSKNWWQGLYFGLGGEYEFYERLKIKFSTNIGVTSVEGRNKYYHQDSQQLLNITKSNFVNISYLVSVGLVYDFIITKP